MTLSHIVTKIGPSEAESLLAQNTHNRRLNANTVETYAHAMSRGEWQFDGAPIRISDEDVLLDGQHRLRAVILSDTVQEFSIWRGVPSTSQDTMDIGRKRTLADALVLRGNKNAVALSALSYIAMAWDSGTRGPSLVSAKANVQIPECLAFIEANPSLADAALLGKQLSKSFPGQTRIWSLAAYLFYRVDATDAEYFFDKLRNGDGLAADSPILLLRNSMDRFNKTVTSDASPTYVLAILIKAWNLFRTGATAQRLVFKAGGAKQEKFPEPV